MKSRWDISSIDEAMPQAAAGNDGSRSQPRSLGARCLAGLAWARATAWVASIAFLGCGSAGSSAPPTGDAATTEVAISSPCSSDPRAQSFVTGLAPSSTTGGYTLALESATPSPPAKGVNSWVITVKDASGAPVDGLSITATPWMPDHRHGSSIVPTIAPTGAAGRYSIGELDLIMPGIWQVNLAVQPEATGDAGGATAATATWTFCISG
jgi:hypothetical protein